MNCSHLLLCGEGGVVYSRRGAVYYRSYEIREPIEVRIMPQELDLTEGRSTGISKILKVMKSNGSPPPEFETDDDRSYFLIRLPVHQEADLGDFVKTEDSEKTQVKTQDLILRILNENPDMTLSEVAQKIGKLLSAVERASSKLVKAGRLKYVGPKKGGHWEVKKKS